MLRSDAIRSLGWNMPAEGHVTVPCTRPEVTWRSEPKIEYRKGKVYVYNEGCLSKDVLVVNHGVVARYAKVVPDRLEAYC